MKTGSATSAKQRPRLSAWHVERMMHLHQVRGLGYDAIGWLYGRRSAEEVAGILKRGGGVNHGH